MTAFRSLALVAALAGTAGTAAAQGKCEINTGSPYQITSARVYLTKATASGGKADERPKHLANGVKVLTEKADKIGNPLGRNWLLAKLLYQWSREEKQPTMTTRGQLGYTDNPGQQIDLLAAIDTALTGVETANPACSDSTRVYRRALFAGLYSKGVEALNADQLDSAASLFRRSMTVSRNDPRAWNGLAIVAQRKNDAAGMTEAFTKVMETAGTDSAYASMRQAAVSNLGVLKVQQAEAAQGAERTRLLREAETLFRNYLATVPSDANAQQGLARVLLALGDTAAITKIYADMLESPDKFSDIQLFEAGSGALRAKQTKIGTQLIAAGLKKNPYFRDALYNLAAAYFDDDDEVQLGPVVKRLVEVDPNNADNWRLYAGQFQIAQQKAQKAKKPAPKWVTDSLLHYINKFQGMTTQVSFSQFEHNGAKHKLVGSVINGGNAPVKGSLLIEFLDKDGQVVASKTTAVDVAPSSSQDFTIEVTQSGIVAFRYKPI